MRSAVIFPFTAIVGQARMKRALILNAINPQIGGVLIRGEKGTAKSTAARALAALLPAIEGVEDCPFNCHPDAPAGYCAQCQRLPEPLPTAYRKTRLVNLPVSATEDRVVGTLDIEKAIKEGERHFEPGVLASANRGILYVDEVNLLEDHVVDILLDSAAMGVNVVEREGISISHPSRFMLVGTMNPEEGDLRPQLLDRFALAVDVRGLQDPSDRMTILERHIQFEEAPLDFADRWQPYEQRLSDEIAHARGIVHEVTYTRLDLATIANLTASLQVDGHRADLVILKTARANAAFEGRTAVTRHDIIVAAELALPHRMKRTPFQDDIADLENLNERVDLAEQEATASGYESAETAGDPEEDHEGDLDGQKDTETVDETSSEEIQSDTPPTEAAQPDTNANLSGEWWEGGQQTRTGQQFQVQKRSDTTLDRLTRRHTRGRRHSSRTDRKRGRYIKAQPAGKNPTDIAFDATIRAAAPYQRRRNKRHLAFAIESHDLQRKVRVSKQGNLILFAVDASWSMAVAERMEATKGAIMSLLTDAYQRRDRVGMIVFQKNQSRLVLPPTNSVQLAQQAL
ncbi:MAG: AAA domain-containing protein, partial [Chloroflexi bacterium]|nr:AAA domain-containing protein [Chloroflexota bacterium]